MSNTAHPCIQCQRPLTLEVVQCPYCGFELGNGESPEAWLGETLDRKYEVEEILGIGGMGMVFKANRSLIGDQIALKILFPHFLKNPLQRRLFEDEAVSTAQLDHPNVITLYDADIDPNYNVAYMAMELLEGYTFKEFMLAEAPMAPSLLYPIFIQVCDGLSAAHQIGLIHRDLKPDNLFICMQPNEEEVVKILDFGIATVMGEVHEDESNKLLGTLRYMAPEQCRGEPSSPQTDLYALGVILYESVTRQRTSGKTIESVIFDDIIPPNQHLTAEQQLPQEFEDLVMSLLSKNPKARPQSALEVRERLKNLQDPFSNPFAHQEHQLSAPFLNEQPTEQPTYRPSVQTDASFKQPTSTPITSLGQPGKAKTSLQEIIFLIILCVLVSTFAYFWDRLF